MSQREQKPRDASILDRLVAWIPGYGGYLDRANRRSADRALRDAVAGRLDKARQGVDAAIRDAVDRAALAEVGPLERAGRKLEALGQRLRAAGSGTDSFYESKEVDTAKSDTIVGVDFRLFQRADAIVADVEAVGRPEGWAKALESDLDEFARALDERAHVLQGIQ